MLRKPLFWVFCYMSFCSCETTTLPKDPTQVKVNPTKMQFEPNRQGYIVIDWQFLAKTKFRKIYDENTGEYLPIAHFEDSVKKLHHKKIRIDGYLISLDKAAQEFVLSAYPDQESFFVGEAGLETVILLKFKDKNPKKDQEKAQICGKMQLNDQDPTKLSFLLVEAEFCN